MAINLLLIYDNGGSENHFSQVTELLKSSKNINVHVPAFPGFNGQPLPDLHPDAVFIEEEPEDYFEVFWNTILKLSENKLNEPWVFYGHGTGGSLILEFARRKFTFQNGYILRPQKTILHSCVGAELSPSFAKWFGSMNFVRSTRRWLFQRNFLQSRWEKRIFMDAQHIPQDIKDKFFADYKNCDAYDTIQTTLNDDWYQTMRAGAWHNQFLFIWGDKERTIQSKTIQKWQNDFPKSSFKMIEGWDRYPMIDRPTDFAEMLKKECNSL